VQCSLTILEGYDSTDIRAAVTQAIKDYINGLSISGDVIRAEIIARIMGVEGVFNVVLTEPATDRIILDDQLVRVQDANITIS